jgi:hypothetical protein
MQRRPPFVGADDQALSLDPVPADLEDAVFDVAR